MIAARGMATEQSTTMARSQPMLHQLLLPSMAKLSNSSYSRHHKLLLSQTPCSEMIGMSCKGVHKPCRATSIHKCLQYWYMACQASMEAS